MKRSLSIIAVAALLAGSSCGNMSGNQNHGPIVLGDSATIVTEKDSQYLRDMVMDIQPVTNDHTDTKAPARDTATKKQAVKDTAAAATAKPDAAMVSGLAVDFGGTKMVLSGIDATQPRKQNAEKENDLAFSMRSGEPGKGKLVFYGAKNVTVKQRYQSRLLLKSPLGTVDLRDLGLYTSGWNTVPVAAKGNTQSFDLNALLRPAFTQINNNKIKNAADRELRKRRAGSKTIQSWMKEIRSIRGANDKPCEVELDNVQWQVSGTDAQGKPFRKNIRIDA